MTAPMTAQSGGTSGSHMSQRLQAHPQPTRVYDDAALLQCIQDCFDCAQMCTACADACLGEQMVKDMVRCIRLNLDCADVCNATGRVLAQQTQPDRTVLQAQLQACVHACRACGAEFASSRGRKILQQPA